LHKVIDALTPSHNTAFVADVPPHNSALLLRQ
jgi:hypothetical protein